MHITDIFQRDFKRWTYTYIYKNSTVKIIIFLSLNNRCNTNQTKKSWAKK